MTQAFPAQTVDRLREVEQRYDEGNLFQPTVRSRVRVETSRRVEGLCLGTSYLAGTGWTLSGS
jgi:hypothetical protein